MISLIYEKIYFGDRVPLRGQGSGWSDGTKMDVFGPKMHIFAIFGWFWVQNHKFTNLPAFANGLIAHISIFIHKHLRIKSIFLLILAYFKGTVS